MKTSTILSLTSPHVHLIGFVIN